MQKNAVHERGSQRSAGPWNESPAIDARVEELFAQLTPAEKVLLLTDGGNPPAAIDPLHRLGLPLLRLADGPARRTPIPSPSTSPLLAEAGLQPSMTAAGNCYDNAPMESFMATLKVEWTHPFTYSSNQFHHWSVELSVPSLGEPQIQLCVS